MGVAMLFGKNGSRRCHVHTAPPRAAATTAACLALLALDATAATFTVTSTADSGGALCAAGCTLRQAITASNADADTVSAIAFAIPGAGVHVIAPATPL